ncbi:tyrosine-type recombinase/integrase [Roseomonas sp. SSH11]|uniref:Tyrosine-type recombinase/integrase n=1 Tax=Pararoseomonas baculiformis TaxID=2820812 RepID=A0ABS4ALD6_9PROT|nr:tyrosine-type recombinase/integrase [Pararoseomonas baculiformis]
MARLTKRVVEAAEVRASEYFIWCDELPGFGVRIYPSGRRGYLVQYRSSGRSRRAKIGLHGRLTVDQARKEAMALLGQVATGSDPAEERATRRASLTVRELCERYLAAAEKGLILGKGGDPKKTSTLVTDRSRITRHIVPLLGSRKVADLTLADVTRFMRDVSGGKTALVEKTDRLRGKSIVVGGKGAAARTVGLLGGILSFAVSEGVIPSNPAQGVRRPADGTRTARLTPATYRQLGRALEEAGAEGENPAALACLWFLALTGCRKGEGEGLVWGEVDEAGQALRLRDSKEGVSVRPLGRAACDALPARPSSGGFVFAGRQAGTRYGGLPGAWERIARRAGLGEEVTLHTLRHSFASTAADLNYSDATVGAMLGHASGTMTGRYIHHLDEVLVAAADRVSGEIWRQMTGDEAAPTSVLE